MKWTNLAPYPVLVETNYTNNVKHELWRIWWPEHMKPGPNRLQGKYRSEEEACMYILKYIESKKEYQTIAKRKH